jgi:hypothetical protein
MSARIAPEIALVIKRESSAELVGAKHASRSVREGA